MNRKLVAVIVAGALALPMTVQAGEFAVSGHIARVIQYGSGGPQPANTSKWGHRDAGVSGSRFRFQVSEDVGNGMAAGVNLEYGAGGAAGDNPGLRHANLTFSGAFGSLAFGHTGPATNGTNDDLSSSGLAVDMACSDALGKGGICTDFTAGRRGVVRYNTPGASLGPVGLGLSLAPSFWDAQISTSGGIGEGSYTFRVSYADTNRIAQTTGALVPQPAPQNPNTTFSVAGAFKYGGTSVSTLWGKVNPSGTGGDTDGYGIKLGYDWDKSGVGVLFRSLDPATGSADPKAWGFGAQHNPADAVSFFVNYYIADPDNSTPKVKTFNVGTRVKF